ncbi:secreted RxLR effector protein 161-like [Rhagoletis pomonella]|uniref:secreted RxLR effector protein 161-like n=1 Tax=Rhagoletis pomonella TaxID=28610 RepID=UPI00177E5FA8|nr:secreted RxLR effector protein 161-like [Rhagoletis pomonella]
MSATTSYELEDMKNVPYQEAVGSILYLSQCTRPDITFAISSESGFNNQPGRPQGNAVKRIFRYLKGTSDLKLTFGPNGKNSELHGYCDADWTSDIDDRKSCTSYVFKYQNGSISWTSKTHPAVAPSSAEAEYMALSAASQEAIWIQQFLAELTTDEVKPIKIYSDNQSAINMGQNEIYSPRTKHIDIRHHFVRECINNGNVKLEYTNTIQMVSDNLTKPVNNGKHAFCTKNFGLSHN